MTNKVNNSYLVSVEQTTPMGKVRYERFVVGTDEDSALETLPLDTKVLWVKKIN